MRTNVLSPEELLVAALLRQAVVDSRSHAAPESGQGYAREAARKWLRDKRAVMEWLDLVGLGDAHYTRLLREAGVKERPC